MIRVVTLDSFDEKQIARLCQTLYTAFGVGSEHSDQKEVPAGLAEPLDVEKLLAAIATKAPQSATPPAASAS